MSARTAKEKKLERAGSFYDHITPPPTLEEENFRHGHWAIRRAKVAAALELCGANTFLMTRFRHCGSQCTIERNEETQELCLKANYCHHRHCEPCARSKANRIARNLRDRIGELVRRDHRFITLTLKHSHRPLSDQIRKLYTSFRKLRKTPTWRTCQAGGVFMLEVKLTPTGWHPHLHIISQGKFITKQQLSQLWHDATGDSFIVDIRQLKNPKDAIHYVCKYITKSTSPQVWDQPDKAQEWITASKGVRTCSTFGSWRGFRLCAIVKRPGVWKKEGSLTDFVRRARGGEEHAWHVLQLLRPNQQPLEID